MRTYKVKFVSQLNAFIFIIASMSIFIFIMSHFFSKHIDNTYLFMSVFILLLLIGYFLWQIFVTGRTEWTIDNKGFTMNWAKQFTFQNNASLNFKWNEIDKIYKGAWDTKYYDLIIKLASAKKLRFYHSSLAKDDFYSFIKDLYQTFNEQKSTTITNE